MAETSTQNSGEIVFSKILEDNQGNAYQAALNEFEKPLLKATLVHCRGNQTKAAATLGLNRGTFRKKLKQHGLHH